MRPVPSDNAAYAVVYNIEAVEGLNLAADGFEVIWTEAVIAEKFHWHARPTRGLAGSFRKLIFSTAIPSHLARARELQRPPSVKYRPRAV